MRAELLWERGRKALRAANDRFGYTGEEANEARELLELALGWEPEADDDIPEDARRRYARLLRRRASGEPMAYIRGWIEFRDLKLNVRRGGFVPRATSEFLAEQAIRRIRARRDPVAVDLATGVGPVALSVAKAVRRAQVHGTDVSAKALRQARQNAEALRLRNVRFHRGDLYGALPRGTKADVVTIHPPYVARHEVRDLPVEIKAFEPAESLTDHSSDGLELVRRAAGEGREVIKPGGWLLVEVAPNVARDVKSILHHAGYADVRSTRGPMRFTRVVVGRA